MAENNPENLVRKPHDHDVLLGRGGLTNNHPGNKRYRDLVLSKKALYARIKRHNKKLMAEEIVHQVRALNPPGRFLDKCESTDLWKPASFERAVKKTSDALRGKEVLKNNVIVQGQQPLYNSLIPIAPANGGITSKQAATVTATTATVAQENKQFDTEPTASQQKSSWLRSNHKKPKAASYLLSGRIPSPTGPVRQQSSGFFRFLSKYSQGFASNAIIYDCNTTNDTMMHGGFDQSMEPSRFAPDGASFLGTSQFMGPSTEPLPLNDNNCHNNKKRSREKFESSPPPNALSLTTLTTQVSDWVLQSFWPVGDDSNCQEEEEQQQQPLQVADPVHQHSQRSQLQKLQEDQTKETAALGSSSLASTSPDLLRQLSVVTERVADLKQQIQIGANADATHQILQIQIQLEQLRSAIAPTTSSTNIDAATTSTTNNVGPAPPPPATLQPSVTSAMRTLASNSSSLFSGLSCLFSVSTSAFFIEESTGVLREQLRQNNNSAPLMRPQPLGHSAQFRGIQNNNAEVFNSISEVANSEQDLRFGRPASGSLFDDDDD